MSPIRFLFLYTLVLYFWYCNNGIVNAINVQSTFEQKCSQSEGFITQDFENWAENVTTFYLPMCSKLDVVRIIESLYETNDLSFIHKHDVIHSCITIHPKGGEFIFKGFCTKSNKKFLTMVEPKYFSSPPTFKGGVSSTLRVSLTDNQSYNVIEVCWGDNQRSFAVLSTKPYLTKCERKTIAAHLKSIGYKEEYFFGLDYAHCADMCHPAKVGQIVALTL